MKIWNVKIWNVYVRALALAVLLLWASCPVSAQSVTAQSPAPTEMRGLWVVRDSLTSPEQIAGVVRTARDHHFNALFVQVRGRGDAYYLSDLEPRAEALSGQPADFDPLAEIVAQGHAAGLQIHAWMNTCLVWSAGRKPYASSHIINRHPDWLARDARGRYSLKEAPDCEGAFLTPANPAARQHIHDVFLDVARRYDVDGIHFDYVRYPNSRYDYSQAALFWFRFQMRSSLTPAQIARLDARTRRDHIYYTRVFPTRWQQFRRAQVTAMVGSISRDIKALKPWVAISAAVFADSADAKNARGQDWKTWLQRGYLDAAMPMAYGTSTAQVSAQIADAVRVARTSGRYVYAGIGAWHIPAASAVAKIQAARALGAQGCVLFSYGGITNDGTSAAYLNKIDAACYPLSASAPAMPWLSPRPDPQSAKQEMTGNEGT